MAVTVRYADLAAAGTGHAGSQVDPWSWADVLSTAAAGDDVYVKGSIDRTTTTDAFTSAGTAASPIVIRGCDASWNPIVPTRTNGIGALVTTGWPTITYTSGQLAPNKGYLIFRGLVITGAKSGATVDLAQISDSIFDCSITNTANNASAVALYRSNGSVNGATVNCDISATGSSALCAFRQAAGAGRITDCRITAPNGTSVVLDSSSSSAYVRCLFFGGAIGFLSNSTARVSFLFDSCVFYGFSTVAYRSGNSALTTQPLFVNCAVTDNAQGFDSEYAGTANIGILRHTNRTRDNTSADSGFADYPIFNAVTTDTGGPETDYLDAANGDFRLAQGSPAIGAGLMGGDIGAVKRVETLPAESNVVDGITFGGYSGAERTGTYSPTYAAAADVRDGVDRGDGTPGTCAVPAAADTRKDVPVDDTVGTLVPGGLGGINNSFIKRAA